MSIESVWIKRINFLVRFLVVSMAVNALFIGTSIYRALSKGPGVQGLPEAALPSKQFDPSLHEILWDFFGKSFQDLLKELENPDHIEQGYSRRDISLACLVTFHHFDIDRALIGHSLQKRRMHFVHKEGGERVELIVFPGLGDLEYKNILSFAKAEQWPLTPEGLFYEIKGAKGEAALSLEKAFFATSLFQVLHTVFNRITPALAQEELMKVLMYGKWEDLLDFIDEPANLLHFNREKKTDFLKKFALHGSVLAIELFVEMEPESFSKKLTDQEMLKMLQTPALEKLKYVDVLKSLASGVRCDAIRQIAGTKVFRINGLPIPDFQEFPRIPEEKVPYVVQKGDNLWKIAKKFNVSRKELAQYNKLDPDAYLKIGQEIQIPQGRGS